MATKLKYISIFSFFFFSSIFALAQKDELSVNSKFASHTYYADWVITSPDMKYITFQKFYGIYSSDTLVLISPKKPEQVLFQASDVYSNLVKFSKKGHLFIAGLSWAKLLKLPNLNPIVWDQLEEAFFSENYNKVVILKDGVLMIYNEDGVLQDQISNVLNVQEKHQRIFYTQKTGNNNVLMQWTPSAKMEIFAAEASYYHVRYAESQKFIIQVSKSGTKIPELFFVDGSVQQKIKLEDPAFKSLKSLADVSKLANGRYFLTTVINEPVVEKTSPADVWYANDNQLEKKFFPKQVFQYMIWDPITGEMVALDRSRFDKHTYSGNGRYLLAVNSFLNQNYIIERNESELYRYDTQTGTYDFLGITGLYKNFDKSGKYLLSHDTKDWVLFDITTKKKEVFQLERAIDPFFSSTSDRVLFPGKEFLLEYNIITAKQKKFPLAVNQELTIVGGVNEGVGLESFYYRNYYDPQKPLLLKIKNDQKLIENYSIYQNSKIQPLTESSTFRLTQPQLMADGKTFLYLKEHYNIRPSFVMNSIGKEQFIYKTNPDDQKVSDYKMEKIAYSNAKGVPLTGLLYYPRGYDSSKKYPMIVGIYEMLRYHHNRYLHDGFTGQQTEGLNVRYYADKGYFVFLPDIVYDDRGPGRAALDCVEASIDALQGRTNIDFQKVGLLGHSHGSYQTNFIATQSKKFAAYVSGAGNADLVRSFNSLHYDSYTPFYWQFEEQQYRIFKPFAEAKELYIDNSPIYHAEKVSSPILLWTGTKDENIEWEQTMEFYIGLRRYDKKVIALFYDDGHSFGNKANREDLFVRISEWFDYHLKKVNSPWISKMYE